MTYQLNLQSRQTVAKALQQKPPVPMQVLSVPVDGCMYFTLNSMLCKGACTLEHCATPTSLPRDAPLPTLTCCEKPLFPCKLLQQPEADMAWHAHLQRSQMRKV